jgi:hypothetical protein
LAAIPGALSFGYLLLKKIHPERGRKICGFVQDVVSVLGKIYGRVYLIKRLLVLSVTQT